MIAANWRSRSRAGAAALPGFQRHAVPLVGPGGAPGGLGRNLCDELFPSSIGQKQFNLADDRQPRQLVGVALQLAVPAQELAAGVILRKCLDAQFSRERGQAVLRGADPLRSQVDRRTADFLAERAPAHAVLRFEHDGVHAPLEQSPGRAESSQARADDHHVERSGRAVDRFLLLHDFAPRGRPFVG